MGYNELIIGLGGCGGSSIKEFRRTLELREEDYKKIILAKDTKIDYLYIDSNNDILNANDWSVFGKNIRLEQNQVIELKQNGVTPEIELLSTYPNISPWIGDLKENFKLRSTAASDDAARQTLQTMDGAGQLRRYGRVLFANHSATVRTTLKEKIDNLVRGRDSEITFRIFCTLGGGTGSGSLIDMITLIQCLCKECGVKAKVILYVYVAASGASASDAGSFYENEYCSLRDLNALMVQSFKPHVTGMPFVDERDAKFNLPMAVNRVYISSEKSPGTPDIKDQIKSITAACFDSIVYAHAYSDPSCLKAISDEDLVDVTPGEDAPKKGVVRSYRFSALGARRWRVPTSQIRELLTSQTEARVWESLLVGNKLPEGISREITHLDGFEFGFELTDTHETYSNLEKELLAPLRELSDAIHKQNRRDGTVLTDFKNMAANLMERVKKLPSDQSRKKAFITSYKKSVAQIESLLVKRLDDAVKWGVRPDVWGIRDVLRYLGDLRDRALAWPASCVPESTPDEIEKIESDITKLMNSREEEWEKLGFLTIHLTKVDERMIEAQCKDACSLVVNSLKSYKKGILDELVRKIDEMIRKLESSVNEFIKRLEATSDAATKHAHDINNGLSESAKTGNNVKGHEMYAFDADNLKNVSEAMAKQVELHESDMVHYTSALKNAVGDEGHMIMCGADAMDTLVLEMRNNLLRDTMERVHERACKAETLQSVLVGDIIERLSQIGGNLKTNWEARLGKLVEQFMKNMPISASLDDSRDGLTKPQVSPAAAIVIGLPAGTKNAELVSWLKDKIAKARPNNYTILGGRMEFYEHATPEEIRVLYVPYWLPCRFASVTKYIEKKYQETLKQGLTDRVYFANYDNTGEDGKPTFKRPSLTKGGEPDVKNEQITHLLESLFIRVNGEEKKVILIGDRGISFAKEVDKLDGIVYTAPYALTNIQIPSSSYKSDMEKALRMAVRSTTADDLYTSMTQEEKMRVYETYQCMVTDAKEGSDEWHDAKELRATVRILLELD